MMILMVTVIAVAVWTVVGYGLMVKLVPNPAMTPTIVPRPTLAPASDPSGFTLVNSTYRISGRWVIVNGSVKNDTGGICPFVEAGVTLYRDDLPVNSYWGHIDQLDFKPGEQSSFEVQLEDVGDWDRYTISFRTLVGCFGQ